MLEYMVQGCSGAGTRGSGIPTPLSRFVLQWVWSCFKMATFWMHSHTLLSALHPWHGSTYSC